MRMEDFQNSIFRNTFVSYFNLVIIYQTQSRRSFSFVAYYLQSTRRPDSVSLTFLPYPIQPSFPVCSML